MRNIKASLFALILAGVFTSAKAQDNPAPAPAPVPSYSQPISDFNPPGYLAFHFGLAQPNGMFASTSGTAYRGYAMPGTAFNLSAGVPVSGSDFGIALMLGSYSNPFNENKYAANVQQTDEARSYSADIQDDYVTSSVLVGPFFTIPLNKVSFDFKALIGVALCRLPEVGYSAYQYNPTVGTTSTYSWDIAPSNSSALDARVADADHDVRRHDRPLGSDRRYRGSHDGAPVHSPRREVAGHRLGDVSDGAAAGSLASARNGHETWKSPRDSPRGEVERSSGRVSRAVEREREGTNGGEAV